MESLEQHFWARIQRTAGCWLWIAGKNNLGYGRMWCDGKYVAAHRLSWELYNGQSPGGLHVLHHCDTPPCVNPGHLFLGTHCDNAADRNNKGRSARGVTNGQAKLTEEQVRDIRLRQGRLHRELAEEFGVSPTLISAIRLGKNWAHLREPNNGE